MRRHARDPNVYLEDILAAIGRIEEYTKGGRKRFLASEMMQDAVIRQLSVVGEAASKLPKTLRARHPSIPWKEMVGMRNILIHDYSAINIRRIWETVRNDLPDLHEAVRGMLDRHPPKDERPTTPRPGHRKKSA
jgi:uncharacterized protein with HEPN domain